MKNKELKLYQIYSCKVDKNNTTHSKDLRTSDYIFEYEQDAKDFCKEHNKIDNLVYYKPETFTYFGRLSTLSQISEMHRIFYCKRDKKGNYNSNKAVATNVIFESDIKAEECCKRLNGEFESRVYFYKGVEFKPYISLDLTR